MRGPKMTKEEQAERRHARRAAEAALGMRPPPKRAAENSLNISKNQRSVLMMCKPSSANTEGFVSHTELDKKFGAKKAAILRIMLDRDLVEFVPGKPGYRQTPKGKKALQTALYNKFRKGVWKGP